MSRINPHPQIRFNQWRSLAAGLALAFQASLAAAEPAAPVRLADGESHAVHFTAAKAGEPQLIWLRGRIALPEGEKEGAYALQVKLNGAVLTPGNVAVINTKPVVFDRRRKEGKNEVWESLPAFEKDAWYLKADSDDVAFNDVDPGSAYYTKQPPQFVVLPYADVVDRAARRSHYYEYLLQVSGEMVRENNTIELYASVPQRLGDAAVEVAAEVRPAGDGVFVYSRPGIEFVYPWQAPSFDDLLGDGLSIRASAGEYEPAYFSVFSVNALEGVGVEIEPLQPASGAGRAIGADAVSCFFVDSLQGKGTKLPWDRENLSPELLIPLPAEGVGLSAGQTQRFVADLKVPEDQRPGVYEGALVLRAGERTIRRVPLRVEVYPFTLLHARQNYWTWRLQYSPIDLPDNVASLRDIKEHGFDGFAHTLGAGFKVKVNPDGTLVPDASEWETLARVLKETGLSNRVNDNSAPKAALMVGARLAGVEGLSFLNGHRMLSSWVLTDPMTGQRPVASLKELPKIKPEEQKLIDELQAKLPQIRQTMVRVMEMARDEAKRIGLDLRIFPVDEPDGTPWRRAWTKFVADIAHEAGLRVWTTHNWPHRWDSGVDESCGNATYYAYAPMEIAAASFTADVGIGGIPIFGNAGARQKFVGKLDDVRVYNRALSDEEILRQHEQPAGDGLLAHYSFDEKEGSAVSDRSGQGNDAQIEGPASRWTEGKVGGALEFTPDGSTRVVPPKLPEGDGNWSISLWLNGVGGIPFYTLMSRMGQGRTYSLQNTDKCLFRFAGLDGSTYQIGPAFATDPGFWTHVTVSVDNEAKTAKLYVHNPEQRQSYRDHFKWNYIQCRSRTMLYGRWEAGWMAWYYRDLPNVTVFTYDLNLNTCLVYPKDGKRFVLDPDNKNRFLPTTWYGTLGWLAVREGIDDARYINTLYELLKQRSGDEDKAWEQVRDVLAPVRDASWFDWNKPILTHGGFDQHREHVARTIMTRPK